MLGRMLMLRSPRIQAGETYRIFVRAKNEAGKGPRVKAMVTLPEGI